MGILGSLLVLVRPYVSLLVPTGNFVPLWFLGVVLVPYAFLCVLIGHNASLWVFMCPYCFLCVLLGP